MIEAIGLSKHYGDFKALDDVSLKIGAGEVVGLLGPNGAGKTTLIRALTGYFEPSEGRVTIDSVDVETDPIIAQKKIGYLPDKRPSIRKCWSKNTWTWWPMYVSCPKARSAIASWPRQWCATGLKKPSHSAHQ